MADEPIPVYVRLNAHSLKRAIRSGWDMFSRSRPLSVSYAMVFSLIGLVILVGIVQASRAPMIFPLAAGFMFIGPVLLSGFFSLADRLLRKEECSFADVINGYKRTSSGMMLVASVCALLFMLWVINIANLYGVMVGRSPVTLLELVSPTTSILSFLLWTSLLGCFLAFLIFTVSAFSVPLMYYRRAGLVNAVKLSVRAVFANIIPSLQWALILSTGIIVSIVIFPLFLITFPVLAFASHALYRELFPD
ncbi:MAG: DUF2189 domain-containing protein [Betaproteobacteria bacterium]